MQSTAQIQNLQPAAPPAVPTADQPGSLFEQLTAVAAYLSLPDFERSDPRTWERIRRARLPHARQAHSHSTH